MLSGIGTTGISPGLWDRAGSPPSRTEPADTSLVALGASSDTDAQITIRTAEGDTVSITLDAETDATYAFYRRPGTEDAPGVQAQILAASSSRDVSISVQGDLNASERADITSLLKRLEHVIRSFVKGNTNAAVRQSLEGPSLDSLAGYALNVEHTDSLVVIQAAADSSPDAASTGVVSRPAVAPMPASPIIGEDAAAGTDLKPHRPALAEVSARLPGRWRESD